MFFYLSYVALFVCVAMATIILVQARWQRRFGKRRNAMAGLVAELRVRAEEDVM